MIKVSIVVPIYNVEAYLHQCLDSLVSQTLKNIEIICVNDGSTDKSLDILREYALKDDRIKIISKANSGYGHTMNIGINAAAGEYIGIVEPDDFVALDMFEELYKAACKNQADIVKSDFYRFVEQKNEIVRTYVQLTKKQKYYNRVLSPRNEQEVFKFVMNTWTGIYRTEFIRSNRIMHNETPGASFQDNGFWFQGFCLCERILFLDKAFYMNRRDNPNSSVKNKEKVYCANNEYNFIKEFLKKYDLYEIYKEVFVMKLWHNYWFTYNRIDKKLRLEYLTNISKELRLYSNEKLFNNEKFSKNELYSIKKIIKTPKIFFYEYEMYRKIKSMLK